MVELEFTSTLTIHLCLFHKETLDFLKNNLGLINHVDFTVGYDSTITLTKGFSSPYQLKKGDYIIKVEPELSFLIKGKDYIVLPEAEGLQAITILRLFKDSQRVN